jgi:predicted nucleic acid-binding protein
VQTRGGRCIVQRTEGFLAGLPTWILLEVEKQSMKLQAYLDTSVISASVDDRMPERQKETEELFHRLSEFEVCISELTLTEIENTRDEEKRNQMSRIISPFQVLEITDEMRKLREIYLREEVFSPASIDDALHVAGAIISL